MGLGKLRHLIPFDWGSIMEPHQMSQELVMFSHCQASCAAAAAGVPLVWPWEPETHWRPRLRPACTAWCLALGTQELVVKSSL